MRIRLLLTAGSLMLSTAYAGPSFSKIPAQTDFRSDALAAYNRGDFKDAEWHLKMLDETGDATASYNLGRMAQEGHIEGCNVICAANWYAKSGERGVPLGYTMAGILLFNNGRKADGINYLKFAARWNDPQAKTLLTQMGEVTPPPDLYAAQQVQVQNDQNARAAQEQAEQLAVAQRELQAQQNQANSAALGWLFGYALGGGFKAYAPATQNVHVTTTCRAIGRTVFCN